MSIATLEWTWNDRIRKLRISTDLTQAEFSALIEVKEGTYAAWELHGNPRDILAIAQRIEEKVGCPGVAAWLLGVGEPPSPAGLVGVGSGWLGECVPSDSRAFDYLAGLDVVTDN